MSALSILAAPIEPGQLRECPQCAALRSQRFARTDKHEKLGEVRVYVCGNCGKEIEYLVSLPDHVI